MYKILVIDDDRGILNCIEMFLMQEERYVIECLIDSEHAENRIELFSPDLIILDMDMPNVTGLDILKFLSERQMRPEVIVLSGVDDVELAIKAIKLGAYDYLTKPIDQKKLITVIDVMLSRRSVIKDANELHKKQKKKKKHPFDKIITKSGEMLQVFKQIEAVAESDNPIMIWGESGTGKHLLARSIHELSGRKDAPFITVNAGIFANELFLSEFFGHVKGAFINAVQTQNGILETANRGTLFLDEIGELPLNIQVKLLRVLQEGEYFKIGASESDKVDVRIITSTNKDLNDEIRRGNFRTDLFYRLNVCSIKLPKLVEREKDIILLAQYFIQKYAKKHKKNIRGMTEKIEKLLLNYSFPGNIRELENIINTSILIETGHEIKSKSMPKYFLDATSKKYYTISDAHNKTISQVEKEHIIRVLEHTSGNRTISSQILGISRVSLISKNQAI